MLVDLYKLKNEYTGLGQFAKNLAQELIAQKPDFLHITFLVPPESSHSFDSSGVDIMQTSWKMRYFPQLNTTFDLWHSVEQFPSFVPNSQTPWLLTIHDLNFLIEKEGTKKGKYLKSLQQNVRQANFLSTISHYTKDQLLKHVDLAQKGIEVIYNGVPEGVPAFDKPHFVDEAPYFFSISHFSPKKNFEVLLPMMQHFNGYRLIIAGNYDTPYGKKIQQQIEKLGLSRQVILAGKISDAQKSYLYQHCSAFLFPSLAEGFGLPVIEAMFASKPVFLSRHTALPEIGGQVAFYFDSFNPEKMAQTIKKHLPQSESQAFKNMVRQHAARFSWERCAAQYIDLYLKCLQS